MRVLITSGPTREYLDPVRFLTNASSGRMGAALAEAFLDAGHEVVVVSGPVAVDYPPGCQVISVVSTQEMLQACLEAFPTCDGMVAAAAPCDFRPKMYSSTKIRRTGAGLLLELVETPDIVGTVASQRLRQWIVAFALETDRPRENALIKLHRKGADLIVVNNPDAINSPVTGVEVLDPNGQLVGAFTGSKKEVSRKLVALIESRFGGKLVVYPQSREEAGR